MLVNRRMPVRRAWFAEGARALRVHLREFGKEHILPTDEDWYLCPLCFQWAFTIDALEHKPDPTLTEEHAPPDWARTIGVRSCHHGRPSPDSGSHPTRSWSPPPLYLRYNLPYRDVEELHRFGGKAGRTDA